MNTANKQYGRLTKKGGYTKELDLKQELGYSYIYNRLAELEDKIENGTLVELPCKVGDIVYQFDNGGEIYESKIRSVYYVENTLFYDCGFFDFDNTAIGQSIFLTRAEAEARLKELQEEQK